MRYLDRLKVIPSDKPDDALILGHALHTGIEKGVEAGIHEYLMAYPIITDAHVNEQIKLEYWIPRVRAALPQGQHEVTLSNSHFIGFIDLLTPATMFHESEVPGLYDLWDFKYAGCSHSAYRRPLGVCTGRDGLTVYMGKQNRRFSVFFTHTTKRLIEKANISRFLNHPIRYELE